MIDFTKIDVSELQKMDHQSLAFISCGGNSVVAKTNPIKITSHGIPRIHPDYCPSDEQRQHILVPLDPNQLSLFETIATSQQRLEEIESVCVEAYREIDSRTHCFIGIFY